jgi:ferredoxin-NADP reductase
MKPGEEIVASQITGDFTLPKDKKKKLVFIAGGIGVTPFRSMIQSLIDKEEQRDVTLFYANRSPSDVVYADVFLRAEKKLGMRSFFAFDGKNEPFPEGAVRRIDGNLIRREVPDYLQSVFYISGPPAMVDAFKKTLTDMGVSRRNIKIDYFSGYA